MAATLWCFPSSRNSSSLARIARRLQVELHANVKGHGWGSPKEFCLELTKLNKWYATGKKSMTRRRGIRRGHKAGPWRSGRSVVLTKKIRKQLKLIGSGTGLDKAFRNGGQLHPTCKQHLFQFKPELWLSSGSGPTREISTQMLRTTWPLNGGRS